MREERERERERERSKNNKRNKFDKAHIRHRFRFAQTRSCFTAYVLVSIADFRAPTEVFVTVFRPLVSLSYRDYGTFIWSTAQFKRL